MRPRLPAWFRWSLERLLPSRDREYVLGDLEEEYARRLARGAGGRSWLASQLLRAIVHRSRSAAPEPGRSRRRPSFEAVMRDLVQATRNLAGAPGLTAIALVTLALGIGANTAIYTLLDHALLRPLPFPEPDRLVRIYNVRVAGGDDRWNLSYPDYADLRDAAGTLAAVGAWREETPALQIGSEPRATRVDVAAVTADLPAMLAMRPVVGRGLRADDDRIGAAAGTAVISHGLWQDRFAGRESAIGTEIRLDGRPYEVVGVYEEPGATRGGGGMVPAWDVDVWVAYLSSMAEEGHELRGLSNVAVLARMTAGATLGDVAAEVDSVAGALAERYPEFRDDETLRPVPVDDVVRGRSRQALWLLYATVSLVLAIAGANVAHLLVGRNLARRREIAVRLAVGASRWQVLRGILAESMVLAAGGAIGGWAVGWVLLRLLAASDALLLPGLPEAALDLRVLAVTATIALAVGLGFGLVPAWQATRRDPNLALRHDARTGSGSDGFRRALTVAETALALVLLVAAALTLQSLTRVLQADPGFVADDVMTARIQLPMDFVSADWPQAVELFNRLLERLEALPEVESAAAGLWLPVDSGWNNSFELPPGVEPPDDTSGVSARFFPVTPGYFETAGIRLVSGRRFDSTDTSGAPGVVVANRAFARRFFPDREALGQRIGCSNWWRAFEGACEIVGVVDDVRFDGRTEPAAAALYFPHAQQPVREMSLMVKVRPGAGDITARMRAELAALDPSVPLDGIAWLTDLLDEVDGPRRAVVRLLTGFAVLALALAAIGVYGVMAFLVARRTREIGIRMALGAGAAQVRRSVLREGGSLLVVGLAIGGLVAALLSRYLESQLFEVTPHDPVAFAGAAAFLLIVGLAACWVPALRATRVNPALSLRTD